MIFFVTDSQPFTAVYSLVTQPWKVFEALFMNDETNRKPSKSRLHKFYVLCGPAA
jgi:hypothetical protein